MEWLKYLEYPLVFVATVLVCMFISRLFRRNKKDDQ